MQKILWITHFFLCKCPNPIFFLLQGNMKFSLAWASSRYHILPVKVSRIFGLWCNKCSVIFCCVSGDPLSAPQPKPIRENSQK